MIAAREPVQRPGDARLLVIGAARAVTHAARAEWVDHLRPGDLVVANDAATLPASLHGTHLASGAPLEVRLAGRASLAAEDVSFSAVLFGAGDWRTRTEERALPPPLALGDRLALGPLVATVQGALGQHRVGPDPRRGGELRAEADVPDDRQYRDGREDQAEAHDESYPYRERAHQRLPPLSNSWTVPVPSVGGRRCRPGARASQLGCARDDAHGRRRDMG